MIYLKRNTLNNYNHNGKVFSSLDVTNNIKNIRNKIINENYLQELVNKYLLNNNHHIRYRMLPDETY